VEQLILGHVYDEYLVLAEKMGMTDLGEASYVLGIEIH
jgi:hypothetical protein